MGVSTHACTCTPREDMTFPEGLVISTINQYNGKVKFSGGKKRSLGKDRGSRMSPASQEPLLCTRLHFREGSEGRAGLGVVALQQQGGSWAKPACLGNLANPHMFIKAANIVSFFLHVLLVLLVKAGLNVPSLMPIKL